GWSSAAGRPLDVVAPPAALAVVKSFLARWEGGDLDDERPPLRFVSAVAGAVIQLDATDGTPGYQVRPVPAVHGDASVGPAVLLDVTGPDGARLLYACDTAAPLPEQTLAALAGREFDIVLMEENNGDRPG
nr:hypothetical protein [Micromonospora sp. DSM 115978]